ncbi:TPA: hypothetical protein ACGBJ4_004737, partial [Escherichia coli]
VSRDINQMKKNQANRLLLISETLFYIHYRLNTTKTLNQVHIQEVGNGHDNSIGLERFPVTHILTM